jgi:predicted acyltransferase
MAVWGNTWDFAHLRIWAVLQRIALCYLLASLFALCCNHKFLLHTIVGLLALYTIILLVGHGYAEDASVNVLAQVDLSLFGPDHLYTKSPVDPEGLVGTISGVAHVLLGFYCGRQLVEKPAMERKVIALFVVGTVLVVAGWLLSYGLPLNKHVWSPSYVMVTCGLASLLQALLMYVIDIQQKKGWTTFFHVFGVNALALYVSSELLAIFLGNYGISETVYGWIHAVVPPLKPASLVYAVYFVLLNFAIGYVLYRKKIYIKL